MLVKTFLFFSVFALQYIETAAIPYPSASQSDNTKRFGLQVVGKDGPGYYITGYKLKYADHLGLGINVGGKDGVSTPSTVDLCFTLSEAGELEYWCDGQKNRSLLENPYTLGCQKGSVYLPSLSPVGLFGNSSSASQITRLPKLNFDRDDELKLEATTMQLSEWVANEPSQGSFSQLEPQLDRQGNQVYFGSILLGYISPETRELLRTVSKNLTSLFYEIKIKRVWA